MILKWYLEAGNRFFRPIPSILIPPLNPAINCVQNASRPGKIAIYRKNGRTDCVLTEQIHNKIRALIGFDLGTEDTIFVKQNFFILVIPIHTRGFLFSTLLSSCLMKYNSIDLFILLERFIAVDRKSWLPLLHKKIKVFSLDNDSRSLLSMCTYSDYKLVYRSTGIIVSSTETGLPCCR